MARPKEIRASDEEREQVVSELKEHFMLGRLDREELALRTNAAYVARTRGELARTKDALPGRRGELLRRTLDLSLFLLVKLWMLALWALKLVLHALFGRRRRDERRSLLR